MKINSIEFKNYRCFVNAKFEFSPTGLNMVIGENGSGKTELLYAIEWALYGIDFHRLQGKENTAYALNSDLYRNYSNPNYLETNFAEVIIEFVHSFSTSEGEKETKCWLRRYAKYTPSGNKAPVEENHCELSIIDDNGNKSVPKEDEECLKKIQQIIPKKVLGGILFDGERMKALSNDDQKSRDTIDGFISDITNIDQLSYSIGQIHDVLSDYGKEIKRISKKSGNIQVSKAEQEKEDNESIISSLRADIKKIGEQLIENKKKAEDYKAELQGYNDIKQYVNERDKANAEKNRIKNASEAKLTDLEDSLKLGYLKQSKALFGKVRENIEINNVPNGLTVEAVKSILERPNCICGEPWTEESRRNVEELIQSLPPENLNTTLMQTIDNLEDNVKMCNRQINTNIKSILEDDERLRELDRIIAEANAKIGSYSLDGVSEIEKNYQTAYTNIGKLEIKEESANREIQERTSRNAKLDEEIQNSSINSKELLLINSKTSYLSKCINVLDEYIALNKNDSLNSINSLIQKAYQEISEEYDLGRRIYITQYTEPLYKIVTYYQSNLDKFKSTVEWGNIIKEYKIHDKGEIREITPSDLDDNLKNEISILRVADSHSTGQRKIVTLSFVKAVMDFATISGNTEGLYSKREYPLFIDAPFSELSGENLTKFAEELPNFNSQSIVMLDPDVYSDIGKFFEASVTREYRITKSKDSNNTKIEVLK